MSDGELNFAGGNISLLQNGEARFRRNLLVGVPPNRSLALLNLSEPGANHSVTIASNASGAALRALGGAPNGSQLLLRRWNASGSPLFDMASTRSNTSHTFGAASGCFTYTTTGVGPSSPDHPCVLRLGLCGAHP